MESKIVAAVKVLVAIGLPAVVWGSRLFWLRFMMRWMERAVDGWWRKSEFNRLMKIEATAPVAIYFLEAKYIPSHPGSPGRIVIWLGLPNCAPISLLSELYIRAGLCGASKVLGYRNVNLAVDARHPSKIEASAILLTPLQEQSIQFEFRSGKPRLEMDVTWTLRTTVGGKSNSIHKTGMNVELQRQD